MSDWIKATSYNDVSGAIVRSIENCGVLATGAKVDVAPGTLTETWIQQENIPNVGAAYVALGKLLSVKRRSDGMHEHLLMMGIFAVAPYSSRKLQARSTNDLVLGLVSHLESNRFYLAEASKPTDFDRAQHVLTFAHEERVRSLGHRMAAEFHTV